jgi:hypothetical protein
MPPVPYQGNGHVPRDQPRNPVDVTWTVDDTIAFIEDQSALPDE